MANKIYAEELAMLFACGCGNPDCTSADPVAQWFHAKCHPEAALDIKLGDCALELYCHKCKKFVVSVAIAKKGEGGE